MNIRPIKQADIPALKQVLDNCELFPAEYLDDMIADYLNNSESTDIWFTVEQEGKPVSIAYCAPERMTEGSYNLYAIGVHNTLQGKGIGKAMMQYIEDLLKAQGNRVLIVDTSGLPEYELTREFYDKCNYKRVGVLPEFWGPGDDKVVFWKKL